MYITLYHLTKLDVREEEVLLNLHLSFYIVLYCGRVVQGGMSSNHVLFYPKANSHALHLCTIFRIWTDPRPSRGVHLAFDGAHDFP